MPIIPKIVYSQLVNTVSFNVLMPEYYNVNISDYFKKEQRGPLPVVNGHQVSWEEYLQREGASDDNEYFVPDPLYVGEDMNCVLSSKTPAGIVDLVTNEVPFKFENNNDITAVLAILDGYVEEIKPYLIANPELDIVLTNIAKTKLKLTNYQTSLVEDDIATGKVKPKESLSITDLLAFVR